MMRVPSWREYGARRAGSVSSDAPPGGLFLCPHTRRGAVLVNLAVRSWRSSRAQHD
jgi:hypothetical protein